MGIKVLTTKCLAEQIGADVARTMAERFHLVQEAGAAPCPASFFFGRDMPYSAPKLPCGYPLRHIHLAPMSDANDLRIWRRQFDAGREQTSDVALVYVQNAYNEYLLIAVLPQAHSVAQMTTPNQKKLMDFFARIGEEFISNDLNDH